MTLAGIEPWSLELLANTLNTRPINLCLRAAPISLIKMNIYLTIDYFQSVVYSPLFWIASCCLFGCLFILLCKVQLVSSSKSFPQTFPPDILGEIFLPFPRIYRKRKRWKSLGERSREYDAWGRTNQPKSNIFFPAWFLLNVALRNNKAQYLSRWRMRGIFFEDFNSHVV